MDSSLNATDLADYLEIGLSAITWNPGKPDESEWVFVNDARCRMAGYSREDILSVPPHATTTRESRAALDMINKQISMHGSFSIESTLHHKANTVVPVIMHMKLIENRGDSDYLLVEHHDIRSYKEAEASLQRARERTHEMLVLIDREKQQLARNIEDNLAVVTFPLLAQLRIGATVSQKKILGFLEERIKHVTKGVGVTAQAGALGANLTRRQILICEMIRDGMTSKDIAAALDCTASTINNHRNTIRRKLGIAGKSANLQAFLNRPERTEK